MEGAQITPEDHRAARRVPPSPPRLVIAGACPPALGGVASHVGRLAARAAREGYRVRVINAFADRPGRRHPWPGVEVVDLPRAPLAAAARLLGETASARPDVVHLHATWLHKAAWIGEPFLRLAPRGGRVLTLHSGSSVARWREGGAAFRLALRALCGRADRVVCVNAEIAALVRDEVGVPAARVVVSPAFMFPAPAARAADLEASLAPARAPGGRVAVLSGAFQAIYGLLDAVEALRARPALAERVGLVFATYGPTDTEYERTVRSRAEGLRCAFLRDLQPDGFADLLSRAAVFLRPTSRDGDSLAVREALHLGLQVLASDAAPRPPGVLLHGTGDPGSLADGLLRLADDPSLGRGDPGPDAWDTLGPLYRTALGAARRG